MQINNISAVLLGVLIGFVLGYANFRVLKSSVASMVSLSKETKGAQAGLKYAFFYSFLFFFKMALIAVMLILAIKVFRVHWLGLGLGLLTAAMLSVIVFMKKPKTLFVPEKKCP